MSLNYDRGRRVECCGLTRMHSTDDGAAATPPESFWSAPHVRWTLAQRLTCRAGEADANAVQTSAPLQRQAVKLSAPVVHVFLNGTDCLLCQLIHRAPSPAFLISNFHHSSSFICIQWCIIQLRRKSVVYSFQSTVIKSQSADCFILCRKPWHQGGAELQRSIYKLKNQSVNPPK